MSSGPSGGALAGGCEGRGGRGPGGGDRRGLRGGEGDEGRERHGVPRHRQQGGCEERRLGAGGGADRPGGTVEGSPPWHLGSVGLLTRRGRGGYKSPAENVDPGGLWHRFPPAWRTRVRGGVSIEHDRRGCQRDHGGGLTAAPVRGSPLWTPHPGRKEGRGHGCDRGDRMGGPTWSSGSLGAFAPPPGRKKWGW